jgi:hypothetical protein
MYCGAPCDGLMHVASEWSPNTLLWSLIQIHSCVADPSFNLPAPSIGSCYNLDDLQSVRAVWGTIDLSRNVFLQDQHSSQTTYLSASTYCWDAPYRAARRTMVPMDGGNGARDVPVVGSLVCILAIRLGNSNLRRDIDINMA